MIDTEQFKKNAIEHNLCAEYTQIWDRCGSKRQIMDMMLGSKGVDYVCDAIAKDWGVTPKVICKEYPTFCNGKYVRDIDGYTSKFYCCYSGHLVADTTIVMLINCSVAVFIPKNNICEIYCTGKTHVEIHGEGRAVFVCYGDKKETTITGTCKNVKRINKKSRDTYE